MTSIELTIITILLMYLISIGLCFWLLINTELKIEKSDITVDKLVKSLILAIIPIYNLIIIFNLIKLRFEIFYNKHKNKVIIKHSK